VAPAARDDAQGRFTAGDAVGYAAASWSRGATRRDAAAHARQLADGAELLTCIAGEQPPLDRAGVEARAPAGVEVEYHEGGQPAVVVAALRGVTKPTLFASTEPLPDDPPARSYPGPAAGGADRRPEGAGAAWGIETWGDLIEHLPHAHRDRRDRPARGRAGHRRGGDRRGGRSRGVTVKPMPRPGAQARRGALCSTRAAPWSRFGSTSPWIARQLGEGSQVLLHGKLRRERVLGDEHELLGDGGAGAHVGWCRPPGHEGITRRSCASSSRSRPRMLAASSRCRRAARGEALPDRRPRSPACTSPTSEDERARRRRLAFEELFLLQLACAGAARAARGPRARPLAARGVVVDRWRWSLPFELTATRARDRRDRRGPRRGAADAAAADGEVGAGKTVVAPRGDAAGGRERRSGRADGARRRRSPSSTTARSTALLGGHDPARAASRARRAPRADATCSPGLSKRASCSSWSARTR
jgi:hypothetical protein